MASFDKSEKEFLQEMQNWREALIKATRVKAWNSFETRSETKLVDEIVKDISKKLMSAYIPYPYDFQGLYGFEERFEQVMSLLCLRDIDVRIIGIWGMGGIGKTTIADAIFHQISEYEYGKCFIQNVRQRLEQCGGLVSVLQQEVLSQVLDDKHIKLHSLTLPQHIKERLYRKKVFIVLDDVDDFLKLQNFSGGLDRLGPGSRIILTSRNRDILNRCGVNDCYIYNVQKLSNQEALQFFCDYAFKQQMETEDLMALSHELLRAIDGNPLALKVVSSTLSILNKDQWESSLRRLRKCSEILKVLQISYDGLEDEDKVTFLDIACFYVEEHKDYVAEILGDCSSLEVLRNRSLITISNSKIIQMHDLLQEMGREIVSKESPYNPSNRSRLWTQEDILDTLKNGDGTNAARGIFLNMSGMNEEQLSSQAFKKMKNLRFLKFYDSIFYDNKEYRSNVCFADDLSYLSDKLKSLNWLGYPFKALPSNFVPKNLVELDLKYSNLEKLCEGTMRAPKLKWIIFRTCPYLIKVSDLLDAPLLEKIEILNCNNLLSFPSPVHQFNKLRELNLRLCKNLRSFPNNISFSSLVSLDLFYCINLLRISDLLDAPLLEMINLEYCQNLLTFPSPIHHFNKLRELNLRHCKNLRSFPNNISFPSLISLDLSYCINLPRISDLLDAPLLEMINLQNCQNLLGFPSPVHHFNELQILNLKHCKSLRSFPSDIQFPSLIFLDLYGCTNLSKISNVLDAPLLKFLDIGNCRNLLGFPSPVHDFHDLLELNLKNCKNLRSFPSTKIHFPSLRLLNFKGCSKFKEFPHIFGQIKTLYMRETVLHEVPSSIENLTELVILDLKGCTKLKHISTNICKLKALEKLYLNNCSALECFPKISKTMESLKILDLSGTAIKELHQSIDKLSWLQILRLKGCKNIHEVPPSIVNLTELVKLDLEGCTGLKHISSSICKLKALTKLDLSNCSTLECFPNILETMENLKILDLSGTAIKGLHESIAKLSGLKELHLKGCKNIDEVPLSIENLTELVELNLARSIRLKHFSINICKLKALRELYLWDCYALECFPEILETMESLQYLDLGGTAIKGLHHSIENLSGLWKLHLRDCKNLVMLPSSIYNLTSLYILNLSGCSKLKNLPGNSVTDLSNYGESATTKPPICSHGLHIDLTNCLNLNKTTIINMMELLIKQHRYMTTKGCATQGVNLKFSYSGSEVPGWLQPLTAGSSTNIQLSGHDGVNGYLIGFAACAVIEFYDEGDDDGGHDNGSDDESDDDGGHDDEGDYDEDHDEDDYDEGDDDEGDYDEDDDYKTTIYYCHRCPCQDMSYFIGYTTLPDRDEKLIDPNQIALWYASASKVKPCGECRNCQFEFFLDKEKGSLNCKVTYCGVCPIYEKTLLSIADQTCASADQDFGGRSIKEQGKIKKFLERKIKKILG